MRQNHTAHLIFLTMRIFVLFHLHDEVEIIYIKKGRGRVTLDFTSLYVEAGDIIIVSPGQLHAIGPAEYSMEYENIIFSLDLLCTGSMDALSSEFFEPFLVPLALSILSAVMMNITLLSLHA